MALALFRRQSATQKRIRRVTQRSSDWWLLAAVFALLLIGILMVFASTYSTSYVNSDGKTATSYIVKHLQWIGIGSAVALVAWLSDYRWLKRVSVLLMIGTLVALFALFFMGKATFGATRWLFNGSIQPSEFAKLATIIYVAHWASSKEKRISDFKQGFIPFMVLVALVCGLIVIQPSLSTALLVGLVAGTMFFVSGADIKQLLAVGSGVGVLTWLVANAGWRLQRIETWRNPWVDPADAGYQTTHMLYALAKGGLLGQGLGRIGGDGFPYVPAIHTDLIMAVVGHEGGLLACMVVLALFVLLTYRGFHVAVNAPDAFGTVLASGITIWFCLQALLNLAVITNSIPTTGIPMPFISYGGSGLVTAMAGVGILLSISRAVPKKA